jgi:hypothetical protein
MLKYNIIKTIHTFIGVFYSDTTGENMTVISEKLLCHFYTLKKKRKQKQNKRELSQVSKYIFKCEINSLCLEFVF